MSDFFKKDKPREISVFFVLLIAFVIVAVLPLVLNHFIERETIWKYDSQIGEGITNVFENAKETEAREALRVAFFSIHSHLNDASRALQIVTSIYPYWEETTLRRVVSPTRLVASPTDTISYSKKFKSLLFRIRTISKFTQALAVFDYHFNPLLFEQNRASNFHLPLAWMRENLHFNQFKPDTTYWINPPPGAKILPGLVLGIRKFRAAGDERAAILFLDVKGIFLSALLKNELDPTQFFIFSSSGKSVAKFISRGHRFFWTPGPLVRPSKIVQTALADVKQTPGLQVKNLGANTFLFGKNLSAPNWRLVYLFNSEQKIAPLEKLWNHYREIRDHYFKIYVYFLLMILLFTIGLSLLILQFFKRKKEKFSHHLKEIGEGSLTQKLDGGRLREFNQIAQSINQMSTRLKETLEEVKESEERYRMLLENAGDAILICKETGEIVEANHLCEKILALSPAELRDENVFRLFLSVPLPQFFQKNGEEQSFSSLETAFHRKDGQQVFLQISSSAIEFKGARYFQLILHDLTHQKLFEEQLVTQNRVLNLLHGITRSIVSKPDLEQAFDESLKNLMELTRAKAGAIYLFEEQRKGFRFAWGSVPDADQFVPDLKERQSVFGLALRNRDIIVVDVNPEQRGMHPGFSKKLTEKYGITRYLGIPLLSEEGAVGLVLLALNRSVDLNEQFRSLLLSVGSQIGLLIRHSILVEQQKKRAYQLELLSQGVKIWIESQNFQAVLQKSVDHLHEKMGYWHVAIFSYSPREKKLRLSAVAGGLENMLAIGYEQSEQKGILGEVLRKKKTYYAPEADKDPYYFRFGEHQSKSELAVPIRVGNDVLGIVNIEGLRPHEFDEIDVATIETFADELSVYYQFANRMEREKQYARRMELVAKLGSILNSSLDPRDFIQSVVEQLQTQMGYFYVSVYLTVEDDKNWLEKIAQSGGSKTRRPLGFRARLGEGLLGKAAETGLLVYSNDTTKDLDFIPVGEKSTGSEVCAPIRINEKVLGVLNVESLDTNAFEDIDIHIVQTIANQMSQALYKARLFSQLSYEKNKLDQILSEIQQGIAMADEKGQILFVNPTFGQYFPAMKDAKNSAKEFPFCEAVRNTAHYKDFQNGKINTIHTQYQNGDRVFLINVSKFIDFNFSQFTLYVVSDISHLKNLEDEKIRGERLKLAMEMAGSIAHEINQPLTGIMGYISLIREETEKDSPLQEDLYEIEKQADRINDLIKKFRNVVKVKTKEYVGETQIIDWENSTQD